MLRISKLTTILIFIILFGCITAAKDNPDFYNSETRVNGVIVHGFCSLGWIQNTNKYPVMIREVWEFTGEKTIWVKTFKPGEIVEQYISHQHGFYVYYGNDMSYIKLEKNG